LNDRKDRRSQSQRPKIFAPKIIANQNAEQSPRHLILSGTKHRQESKRFTFVARSHSQRRETFPIILVAQSSKKYRISIHRNSTEVEQNPLLGPSSGGKRLQLITAFEFLFLSRRFGSGVSQEKLLFVGGFFPIFLLAPVRTMRQVV